jgi:hypothetical protein
MPEEKVSPLTGQRVTLHYGPYRDIWYFDDICGGWGFTWKAERQWEGASIFGGHLRFTDRLLSEPETRKTFALARSEVWRLSRMDAPDPLFMTLSGSRTVQPDPASRVTILTLEDIEDTSRQLTLERKARRTLQNLVLAEGEMGVGVEVPYLLQEYPGEPLWNAEDPPEESGVTYGCTSTEAPIVYQLLASENQVMIREPQAMGQGSRVFITPAGYAEADAGSFGAISELHSAFLVCRFIEDLDHLYDAVIRPLGEELKLPVRRIKDIHHIDKIDDRICQEIREATIVMVDLTDQNFNVAFEAGYALALGKAIVWTKKRETDGIEMPFDIYTYNCLQWDPEDLTEFRENLKYRILAALEKAKRSQGSNY